MIYTLLGWEGLNASTMQKIIEIMTFDDRGSPQFGKKVFTTYKEGDYKRILFRYSSQATMVLRYDEQFITNERQWNSARKKFDENRSKTRMIIFDRLVPLEQKDGSSPLLVPSGDIYDGFIFEDSSWNYIEGVDARNY